MPAYVDLSIYLFYIITVSLALLLSATVLTATLSPLSLALLVSVVLHPIPFAIQDSQLQLTISMALLVLATPLTT